MSKNIDIFVISLASPILIGIYENNTLIDTLSIEGKTSEALPEIFSEILKKYSINNIIYVNGPGSYMAIKVAYIFLKTISITKDINFLCTSGFDVNNNSPIKALGKKYFVQDNNGEITMRVLQQNETINNFELPQTIDITKYSEETLPNYQLPAVV
jgi:tRNA A37 threonylcarbamoyladenosine modification protein TsaB